MEENEKCPKCKGEKFIKVKTKNEMGFEYEFYKPCSCMKNPRPKAEHKNPFDEGGRTDAVGD